ESRTTGDQNRFHDESHPALDDCRGGLSTTSAYRNCPDRDADMRIIGREENALNLSGCPITRVETAGGAAPGPGGCVEA
ncbi:MAG: hypothetical protein KJ749_05535, partial [Planctomycetes bacterium]|nr:hypothetical protein [Planctomycetota bacterium]